MTPKIGGCIRHILIPTLLLGAGLLLGGCALSANAKTWTPGEVSPAAAAAISEAADHADQAVQPAVEAAVAANSAGWSGEIDEDVSSMPGRDEPKPDAEPGGTKWVPFVSPTSVPPAKDSGINSKRWVTDTVHPIEFRGIIDGLPAGTLIGTWTVAGHKVHVTSLTDLKDQLGALVKGAYVQVIGRLRLDGSIDAAKILVKKLEPGKGHDNSRKPEVAEPDKVKSVPPGQLQHPAQPDKGKGHK